MECITPNATMAASCAIIANLASLNAVVIISMAGIRPLSIPMLTKFIAISKA